MVGLAKNEKREEAPPHGLVDESNTGKRRGKTGF